MSMLLLLHSALGLRPGVEAFAERLCTLGHHVVVPDYYDGQVFDDESAGIAYRDEIGASNLLRRVTMTLDGLPADAAIAGMSLGAAFASNLALRRPGASAVILMHHAAAPSQAWPGIPTQLHRYETDPWVDPAEVLRLRQAVVGSGATFEDFVTPGTGHLFTDPDLPDFNATATEQTIDHIDRLLWS